MTKEQEAIEKLTNGEKIDFNSLIRKFKKEGIENFVVTKKEYIETVLSMLKENSAEIEQKNTELAEKNAEIERLNRQIDLMAEEINETDRGYTDYCEMKIECDRNCKDCIKRYFKRKATKNGQERHFVVERKMKDD